MPLKIAIYGYDSDVGRLVLETMEERKFEVADLFPLSPLSGQYDAVTLGGENYMIRGVDDFDFSQADVALFLTTPDESERLAPQARKSGCIVVDGSRLFSTDPAIPVIAPELNPFEVKNAIEPRLVIPASSVTSLIALCAAPLADEFGLERLSASVMESVSEQGRLGTETLAHETVRLLNGQGPEHDGFEAQVAFNLHTRVGKAQSDGYTEHEHTVMEQLKHMLGALPGGIDVTAVQVPVFYAHTAVIHVDLKESTGIKAVKEALSGCEWIALRDDSEQLTPVTDGVTERNVLVSRVRAHGRSGKAFSFIAMLDNLRRGEAVSVAEIVSLLEKSLK